MREPTILFEGACAYAVKIADGYSIRVFSSNAVTHIEAGTATNERRAERVCKGLNAYPKQTRAFHGLL